MKCERCGADTSVVKHSIDGYDGYLCDECREVWAGLVESSARRAPRPATSGRFSRI